MCEVDYDFMYAIKFFETALVQCVKCRKFRLADEFQYHAHLQMLVNQLNQWALSVDDLKAFDLKVSHGFCKMCAREQLIPVSRKRQEKEGYYPCFGTAVDGCCSESGLNGSRRCKYYNACVTTRDEIEKHRAWVESHPPVISVAIMPEEITTHQVYFFSSVDGFI